MKPKNPPRRDLPSPSQMEAFEERAAIIESGCEGMTREAAEEAAWKLLFGNRFLRQTYMEFKGATNASTSYPG